MTIKKSRREFLKDATSIGTGLCTSSLLLSNSSFFNTLYAEDRTSLRSRVILAKDKRFINANGKADATVIRMAMDSALLKITNSEKPLNAWRTLQQE